MKVLLPIWDTICHRMYLEKERKMLCHLIINPLSCGPFFVYYNLFLRHRTAPTFSLSLLSLDPGSYDNMYVVLLLVLTFFSKYSRALNDCFNDLQPGCFPVPSLFENYSTAPENWPHGTPLLQILDKSADISRFVKRVSGSWNGWQNVHNIFALYALDVLDLPWYTH